MRRLSLLLLGLLAAWSLRAGAAPDFRDSAFEAVAPGASLELSENYVMQDSFISAELSFDSFQPVLIGRRYNGYRGAWLAVTADSVVVYKHLRKPERVGGYRHGLRFGGSLFVTIDAGAKTARILLDTPDGESFEQTVEWFAGGPVFLLNQGGAEVRTRLSFFPKNIGKSIWIFGDSYMNASTPVRWPYYLHKQGYRSFLNESLPGSNSDMMMRAFKNDLRYGTPRYALWLMGMNDGSDKDGAPNGRWLRNVEEFLSICDAKGIVPVLATIPTVPKRFNEEKNAWVRASGRRFIDFARAVGAMPDGSWIPGLQYSDQVHTTVAGAKVLELQCLVDFPEITINE